MATTDGGRQPAANFARNIRARREAAGMSQEHLAEAMSDRGFGFTQATVWKVESGQRGVALAEAVALADILSGGGTPLSVESLMRPPDADRARQLLESTSAEVTAASSRIEAAVADYLHATESYAGAFAVALERTPADERIGAIWEWTDPVAPELIALAARISAVHGDDEALESVEAFRRNLAERGWVWDPVEPADITKEMTDDG